MIPKMGIGVCLCVSVRTVHLASLYPKQLHVPQIGIETGVWPSQLKSWKTLSSKHMETSPTFKHHSVWVVTGHIFNAHGRWLLFVSVHVSFYLSRTQTNANTHSGRDMPTKNRSNVSMSWDRLFLSFSFAQLTKHMFVSLILTHSQKERMWGRMTEKVTGSKKNHKRHC